MKKFAFPLIMVLAALLFAGCEYRSRLPEATVIILPTNTPQPTYTPLPTYTQLVVATPEPEPTFTPIPPEPSTHTPRPFPTNTPIPPPTSTTTPPDTFTPIPFTATAVPELCRVIHDYELVEPTEVSTSAGNTLHVEFWWPGEPEREVVLPGGRYVLTRALKGHVWEYSGCTSSEVYDSVVRHINERRAQKANNVGWVTSDLMTQLFIKVSP